MTATRATVETAMATATATVTTMMLLLLPTVTMSMIMVAAFKDGNSTTAVGQRQWDNDSVRQQVGITSRAKSSP
jgi:hypothetical protein